MDPYSVLGIAPGSPPRAVKAAYRRMARLYHPDVNVHDPAAAKHFGNATAAYEHLHRGVKFAPPYPDYITDGWIEPPPPPRHRAAPKPPSPPQPPPETRQQTIDRLMAELDRQLKDAGREYRAKQQALQDVFADEDAAYAERMANITVLRDASTELSKRYIAGARAQARADFEAEMSRLDGLEKTESVRIPQEYAKNTARAEEDYVALVSTRAKRLRRLEWWLGARRFNLREKFDERVKDL